MACRVVALCMLLTACGASGGTATLTWVPPTRNTDGSSLKDLAGYTIYFGRSPKIMDHVIQIRDPSVRTYIVSGLDHGDYFFSIDAYTTAGVRSELTPPVHKWLP